MHVIEVRVMKLPAASAHNISTMVDVRPETWLAPTYSSCNTGMDPGWPQVVGYDPEMNEFHVSEEDAFACSVEQQCIRFVLTSAE